MAEILGDPARNDPCPKMPLSSSATLKLRSRHAPLLPFPPRPLSRFERLAWTSQPVGHSFHVLHLSFMHSLSATGRRPQTRRWFQMCSSKLIRCNPLHPLLRLQQTAHLLSFSLRVPFPSTISQAIFATSRTLLTTSTMLFRALSFHQKRYITQPRLTVPCSSSFLVRRSSSSCTPS